MNVLSLFDGIACGRLALERTNIKVDNYYAFEIDESAIKIAKKNYPDIIELGDVMNADFTQFKNIDLLIGGSPCTYWSIAKKDGKRETDCVGLGWELFKKYKEALDITKPKYFLYENNASINPKIKEQISKELGVDCKIINSNLVSAQSRKRCYWTNIDFEIEHKEIYLKDILEKERKDWRPVGAWVWNCWKSNKNPKISNLKDINSLKSNTLTTKKFHPQNYILNAEHDQYTNFTINEYEILQTLPIDYTSGVKEELRFKAIGNGWTVDIIKNIFEGMCNNSI